MSEKGIYKKANGPGWDYDPDNKRAKENKFFDKIASDKVATRKKSLKRGKPRADHKHEYKSVVVRFYQENELELLCSFMREINNEDDFKILLLRL